MSGTHGEHNTSPKRLSTRAMRSLTKNSLMCSSLDSHPDYKISRIESQLKLSRTQHVRNNVRSASRNHVRATSCLRHVHRFHCGTTSSSRSRRINQGPTQFRSQLYVSTLLPLPQFHTLPATCSASPPAVLSFPSQLCFPSKQST